MLDAPHSSRASPDHRPINLHPNLDAATGVFIEDIKRRLASAPDLSEQFSHENRKLRGSGAYSSVFVTLWAPPDSHPRQVCYKELRPPASDAQEQIDLVQKTIRHLAREVKIWKDLDHPNIVKFFGYAIEGEGCHMKAALVSEWCVNGNVVEYLKQHPESNRIALIQDMAHGLNHLHTQSPAVIHGDLKPQNLVINNQRIAQLCDFGLSRVISGLSGLHQTTSTAHGYTMRYSSYEVIVEDAKNEKSDVYAFGCTCIYILFNGIPFPDLKEYQVMGAIDNRKHPWEWDASNPLERVLSECCILQQENRRSIGSVLQALNFTVAAQFNASQHNQNVMAAHQQQLGGAKLQLPTQPTPQPPNALAAYSSPQPPPPSHQQSQGTPQQQQQNVQQSNMGPLTQPPLLAQQFRPNPGVHSAAGMSGASGGGGDSSAGNAYQSIQGQGSLPSSLRGTNPSAGSEAPGEAGLSQTSRGGQLLPGQGQIPSQAGPLGQSQPPGAVSGPTVPQQTELRNFVNGLSQRSTEDLLRSRDAFDRSVKDSVLRLRQGVSRGFPPPKETIENISRERKRLEILREGLAKEMARRGMDPGLMQVPPDSWSGKPPQPPRGPQQQPQSQPQPQPPPQQFASGVLSANPQQPIRYPTPQVHTPQQQQQQSASQRQQAPPTMSGPSQIANHTLLPHQPPQQPTPTNAPPSMNVIQIPPPTVLLTEKAMFMRTLAEIFRKRGLTGEDIPKHNGVGIDLFSLFREVIRLGGRDIVGQTPGGWDRMATKFGVFQIQEVYINLLDGMEDIFRNGLLLAKQHHAQNQARQQQAHVQVQSQPQLLQHQWPPEQQSQPQQPQPSQQQLLVPMSRPGGQGALSRPTSVPESMNIPVPQPPMHLTEHQVINVARLQKRAEEAKQLKTMLKAQAPRHRDRPSVHVGENEREMFNQELAHLLRDIATMELNLERYFALSDVDTSFIASVIHIWQAAKFQYEVLAQAGNLKPPTYVIDLNELRTYRKVIQPHIENHRILEAHHNHNHRQGNQQLPQSGMPSGHQPPQQHPSQRPGHPAPRQGSPSLDLVSGNQHVVSDLPSAQQGSLMATPTIPPAAAIPRPPSAFNKNAHPSVAPSPSQIRAPSPVSIAGATPTSATGPVRESTPNFQGLSSPRSAPAILTREQSQPAPLKRPREEEGVQNTEDHSSPKRLRSAPGPTAVKVRIPAEQAVVWAAHDTDDLPLIVSRIN